MPWSLSAGNQIRASENAGRTSTVGGLRESPRHPRCPLRFAAGTSPGPRCRRPAPGPRVSPGPAGGFGGDGDRTRDRAVLKHKIRRANRPAAHAGSGADSDSVSGEARRTRGTRRDSEGLGGTRRDSERDSQGRAVGAGEIPRCSSKSRGLTRLGRKGRLGRLGRDGSEDSEGMTRKG